MGVLMKYLLHDMLVQYRRTLLVLVTLLLSAAAMLAAVALSDTMVALGTSQWRAENGYADILISAAPSAGSRFINEFSAASLTPYYEWMVFRIASAGELETANDALPVTILGYNLNELSRMIPLHFLSQTDLYPFEGQKAVISRKTAIEQDLAVGDILTLRVSGNRHDLVITAIAYAEGPFAAEKDTAGVLVPISKMQAWLGELGRVDSIYIKLNDPQSKGRVIRSLSDACPNCRVAESYSEDNIRLQSNRTSVPFIFMSVLLCFMAVYVLFILFKGIVAGRLPLMGLFRAIGAYRQTTWLVLLTESLLYGVIGGLFSWLAGYGLLWIIIRILNSGQSYQYIPLVVGPIQLLLAMGCAVVTSLTGALVCLISEGRADICRQLRGVMTNIRQNHRAAIAGGFLLAVSLMPIIFWRSERGLAVYILCVLGLYAGVALLSPAFYSRLSIWMTRFFRRCGGPWRIALLNLRGRKDFAASATIISIIVATTMVIAAISYSDRQGVVQYKTRIRYGLELTMSGLDRQVVNLVRQTGAVDAVCANYYSGSVEVAGQSIAIYRVQGVTPEHGAFIEYNWTSHAEKPLQELEKGRNILLTLTLQNIYHIREGDSIILKIYGRDGRYRERAYTVIGFFDDWQTKLGRYALISQANFQEDFAAREYDSLYVRAEDVHAAADALTTALSRQQLTIRLVADEIAETAAESAKIVGAMSFISGLAIATGMLGILNLTLLSFMKRKRELGLYYAMGLTAGQIFSMILAELFWAALFGALAGSFLGLIVMAVALPRLIFALQIALRIDLSIQAFWIAVSVGFLIALAAAALSLLFLRRNNPMAGLRQEE